MTKSSSSDEILDISDKSEINKENLIQLIRPSCVEMATQVLQCDDNINRTFPKI